MPRPSTRPIPSAPTTTLHRAGCTVVDVAARAGYRREYVSRMLSGSQPATPRFWTALVAVAGERAADEIAILLGVER